MEWTRGSSAMGWTRAAGGYPGPVLGILCCVLEEFFGRLQTSPGGQLVFGALGAVLVVLLLARRRLRRLHQRVERKLWELHRQVSEREKLYVRCRLLAREPEAAEASSGAPAAGLEAAHRELPGALARHQEGEENRRLQRAPSAGGEPAAQGPDNLAALQAAARFLQQLLAEKKDALCAAQSRGRKSQGTLKALMNDNAQLTRTVEELTREAEEWKQRLRRLQQQKDGTAAQRAETSCSLLGEVEPSVSASA